MSLLVSYSGFYRLVYTVPYSFGEYARLSVRFKFLQIGGTHVCVKKLAKSADV